MHLSKNDESERTIARASALARARHPLDSRSYARPSFQTPTHDSLESRFQKRTHIYLCCSRPIPPSRFLPSPPCPPSLPLLLPPPRNIDYLRSRNVKL